jgi:hypothetical protein
MVGNILTLVGSKYNYFSFATFYRVLEQIEWKDIKKSFEEQQNFLNYCYAVDGECVRIRRPARSGSEFVCYDGIYNIILFAVVDGNFCYQYTDVLCSDRTNDGSVFQNSLFNLVMQNNQLNLRKGCLFIGDDGFSLRRYLLKLYGKNNLTVKKKDFQLPYVKGKTTL